MCTVVTWVLELGVVDSWNLCLHVGLEVALLEYLENREDREREKRGVESHHFPNFLSASINPADSSQSESQ